MGFFDDLVKGASRSMANQPPPTIDRIAEMQKRKDRESEIARQEAQQAFANMMTKNQFDYTKQRGTVEDEQWEKEFGYNAGRVQVGDEQWEKTFGQTQQNSDRGYEMDKAQLNVSRGTLANSTRLTDYQISGAGDPVNRGGVEWLDTQSPDVKDDVYRTKFGLQAKVRAGAPITAMDAAEFLMMLNNPTEGPEHLGADGEADDNPWTMNEAIQILMDANSTLGNRQGGGGGEMKPTDMSLTNTPMTPEEEAVAKQIFDFVQRFMGGDLFRYRWDMMVAENPNINVEKIKQYLSSGR